MVVKVLRRWGPENLGVVAAGLAFYIILSFAPLVALVLGFTGVIFEQSDVQQRIVFEVGQLTNQQAADAVKFILQNVRGFSRQDLVATIIGLVVLLWSASSLFLQLHKVFNHVFKAPPKNKHQVILTLERYGLALLLIVSLTLLIILAIFSETLWQGVQNTFAGVIREDIYFQIWRVFKFCLSTGVLGLVLAALYKYVPDMKVKWAAAWRGGLCASLLYAAGAAALSIYFASGIANSAFSAASSLIVVLVWVYFAAQVILLGAVITSELNDDEF